MKIINATDSSQTLDVKVKTESKIVYDEHFELAPDEEIEKKSVLKSDRYEVHAELNGIPHTFEYTSSCKNGVLGINIKNENIIDFIQHDC